MADDHEIHLWGCNKFGQLSLDPGTTPQLSEPYCLSSSAFGGHKIKCIVSGWTHNMALSGESSDMFCTLYTSESVLGCCHFIYHTQKNLSFINQPKELGLVQYKEM